MSQTAVQKSLQSGVTGAIMHAGYSVGSQAPVNKATVVGNMTAGGTATALGLATNLVSKNPGTILLGAAAGLGGFIGGTVEHFMRQHMQDIDRGSSYSDYA